MKDNKEKMKKELDEMLDTIGKMLGESGEKLKELMEKSFKPEFKIHMETHKKGIEVEVQGSRASLKFAISTLIESFVNKSNLTEKDIREAVDKGFEWAENDEDEDEDDE